MDAVFYAYKRGVRQGWNCSGKLTVTDGSVTCIAGAQDVFRALNIEFTFVDFGRTKKQRNCGPDDKDFRDETISLEIYNEYGKAARVQRRKELEIDLAEVLAASKYDLKLQKELREHFGYEDL
jgi:hypothetical protein